MQCKPTCFRFECKHVCNVCPLCWLIRQSIDFASSFEQIYFEKKVDEGDDGVENVKHHVCLDFGRKQHNVDWKGHTHIHATHTLTHTHNLTITNSDTHSHSNTHLRRHTHFGRRHSFSHSYTHTQTHTSIRKHTQTHTNTHKHTREIERKWGFHSSENGFERSEIKRSVWAEKMLTNLADKWDRPKRPNYAKIQMFWSAGFY